MNLKVTQRVVKKRVDEESGSRERKEQVLKECITKERFVTQGNTTHTHTPTQEWRKEPDDQEIRERKTQLPPKKYPGPRAAGGRTRIHAGPGARGEREGADVTAVVSATASEQMFSPSPVLSQRIVHSVYLGKENVKPVLSELRTFFYFAHFLPRSLIAVLFSFMCFGSLYSLS